MDLLHAENLRRLYFPSEGRGAEDFFSPKNPTASAGFEPANLGTKGQHATPRHAVHEIIIIKKNLSGRSIQYDLYWVEGQMETALSPQPPDYT